MLESKNKRVIKYFILYRNKPATVQGASLNTLNLIKSPTRTPDTSSN